MGIKSIGRNILGLAIASGFFLFGATAPAASAEAPENLVAIGDSITADPAVDEWFPAWIGLQTPATAASPVGCPTSPNSYAKQAGDRLGLQVDDYSCTGLSLTNPKTKSMEASVDQAVRDGALNASTQRVILTVGFNDTYTDGTREEKLERFLEEGTQQVNRIRAAAPHARIQMVGYPTISTDGGTVCPLHLVDSRLVPAPPVTVPVVEEFEDLAQEMQRSLATRTEIEFLDMKPDTRSTSMCGEDGVREYAGLIDTTGPVYHLPLHVNGRGHSHIASKIVGS